MASYRLSSLANTQQDDIWRYTEFTWGQSQAISYIEGLHVHFEKLARVKALWRSLPQGLVAPSEISTAVYFSRYMEHLIFFRELSNGVIGIISVLHSRSDIPGRLSEDLYKISKLGDFEA